MGISKTVNTKWVVITGAPSSGKTSLIRALEKEGFPVVEDIARRVHEANLGSSCPSSEQALQLEIFEQYKQQVASVKQNQLVLFDYGVPDHVVFQQMANFVIPEAEKYSKEIRYNAVFICRPLAFQKDGIRDKNEADQAKIQNRIESIYRHLGYEPILLMPDTLDVRLKIIKEKLGEYSDTFNG